MILSSSTIKKNREAGILGIDPFIEANLKEASYTFTLSSSLKRFTDNQTLRTDIKPIYEEFQITEEGYLLKPGEFMLGFTREKLTLNGKFACLLCNRGSCAQIGLDVLLSSLFAEPNTDSLQILEIKNSSSLPILLLPGMLIVKGIFLPLN